MKRFLFSLVCASLFLFINTASAQTVFVLQNGSRVQFIDKPNDVISNIQAGDTLYLPARVINENWAFDKQVHIIGAGYHPDSTQATGITKMTSNLTFNKGSKGSSITGVRIEGTIYAKDSAISVTRCNMGAIDIQNGSEPISQIYVGDCVIRGNLYGGNDVVTNCLIERCVIHGNIGQGDKTNNLLIKNCILTYPNSYFMEYVKNLTIQNSILTGTSFAYASHYTFSLTFKNNLFVRGEFTNNTFEMSGNVFSVPLEEIFVDFENGDYRIKSTCTQALNLATDGGQVGIYGTEQPFLVPTFAPRFTSIENAENVVNGKLNVKMKVEARDR